MEFPYFLLYSTPVDAYLTMDSMGPPYGVNRCLLFPTPAYPSSLWIQVKRVKPFRQRCTRAQVYVWIPLYWIGKKKRGRKKKNFSSVFPASSRGCSSFVWKDTVKRDQSVVRGRRKYDFFAAVMACAMAVAFLSLRFWKGPGVITCRKSVWDD